MTASWAVQGLAAVLAAVLAEPATPTRGDRMSALLPVTALPYAPTLTITVYGNPAPQGSKRHVGGGRMVESSKHLKPWRDAVRSDAILARQTVAGWEPIDAPIVVEMVFTVAKPASAPKTRRTWPMRMPDLSKLIRSTEDALTDAGIVRDDARIVEYRRAAKVYPGEDIDALDSPGVVVRLWAVPS